MTIILLFSACLTASAGGIVKKVTMSQNNINLEKVFREIKKQTGYVVFYEANVLQGAKSVNINLKDPSVEEVLKQILHEQPLDFSIERKTVMIVQKPVIPKSIVDVHYTIPLNIITGTVKDQLGNSLAGVSVILKGTSKGTSTNADGSFNIDANVGDVLEFSFVGYKSKNVTVGQSNNLNVVMEIEATMGSEVVVVGYGTQSRRDVTSSIAKLDASVLKNVPRANIGSALQGTLPGLEVVNTTGQPGATPSVLLRGGASINNPGGPLVVVDGIIRPYNDIPSEDIASIELLRDAASTAIYGARANNGVLLITTKEGKAGKAQISYKFTTGFNGTQFSYKFLNTKDYIYYTRMGNLNSGRSLSAVNNTRGYGLMTDSANLASFDIREFDANTAYLLGKGWDTVGDPYGGTIIFKDHSGELQNIVLRNTNTQDHYVSAEGGNDKGKYFSSFDYYKEEGIVVSSNYQRFSGNINGSYKIKQNLEVSSGVTASTSSQLGVVGSQLDNIMYRSLSYPPTFNPWIDSAKTKPNPGNQPNDGNQLYWISKNDRNNEVNRITANASVKWDLLPSLYLKGTGSGYLFEGLDQSFQKATQNYVQMFASPPNPGNTTRQSSSAFSRNFQQQYNLIANYSKLFNKHNLNIMLGTEYYDVKSFDMQVLGTQAPTDDIPTANASTVFSANTSTDPNNLNNNFSSVSDYKIISTFGRLNYNYNQRYLLTLVFRRDGVSSLPKQHHFGFFPGLSGGWNIHKEAFFQNMSISKIISTFKPRISYGVNGNVAGLGNYDVQGVYGLQGLYNGNAGFLNTEIVNSNLHWEKSETTDLGLDMGLLQDKITFNFDYYNRKTSGLLTDLPLPSYTGFTSITTNLGTFQNIGYEFTLNARILNQPEGLKWDINANASFNKNKILRLPPNGQPNNRQGGMQVYDPKTKQLVWVGGFQEGHTLGDLYAYKQVSIFKNQKEVNEIAGNRIDIVAKISGSNSNYGTGKITPGDVNWLDVDKNDTIDTRDQVYMGNINPKWTGGFSTTLSDKGFTLYSRFQFALGYVIYNSYVSRILGNFQGTFNYIDWMKRSWTPTNEVTDIPKVYYADQVSAPAGKKNYSRRNSHFFEKGNYLACREITLSYDFSHAFLSKIKVLSQSRIYVSLNNFFYITNFTGSIPEPPANGTYEDSYPVPKSVVLGVQLTF